MGLNYERPEGAAGDAYSATVRHTYGFARSFAPMLFMWIEWCGLLALLRYAQLKTNLWPLQAIQWILAIALWGYFMSLSASPMAEWLPKQEAKSVKTFASIALSLGATAGLMFAAFWLADVFMKHPL